MNNTQTFHWNEYVEYAVASMSDMMGSQVFVPDLIEAWENLLDMKNKKGISYPEEYGGLKAGVASIMSAASMYTHAINKQQTFVISNELYDLFLRTSLNGVTKDELKMPYDCIYVALPKGRIKIWGGDTEWHNCGGIYARNRLYFEMPNKVSKMVGKPEGDTTHFGLANSVDLNKLNITPEDLKKEQEKSIILHAACLANDKSVGWGDDAHVWSSIENEEWGEHGNLEDWLYDKIFIQKRTDHNGVSIGMEDLNNRHNRYFFDACKVVLNAIVYLNNGLETKTTSRQNKKDLDMFTAMYKSTTSESKCRTYGRKTTKLSKPTITILGPNIKRSNIGTTSEEFIVRGHWHTYRTGKGRLESKRLWLQPYIKNKKGTNTFSTEPRIYEYANE